MSSFDPIADIPRLRETVNMATPLPLWLLFVGSSVAACDTTPSQKSVPEREQARSAAADDDELEWPCQTFEEQELRGFCERYMAHPRPSHLLVDRVEARLASNSCVRDLSRWQRLYSFASRKGAPREIDESRVAFSFRQAGVEGFRSERRITAPEVWVQIDDRDYDFVAGYFDIGTGELTIDHCGANLVKP